MNEIVDVLIVNALKAAILACGVGLLAMVPRVRNLASVQHTLWLLVLAMMIAPPLVSLPLLSSSQALTNRDAAIAGTSAIHKPQIESQLHSQMEGHAGNHDATPTIADRQTYQPIQYGVYALIVLFTGSVVILIKSVIAIKRLRRMLGLAQPASQRVSQLVAELSNTMGIHKSIEAVVVSSKTSPFIWTDRSRIYVVLPTVCESADQAALRCIVLHELAHYKRRDHRSNTFATLVLVICWWNPVAWFAMRRMRALQEYCCDAIAISQSKIARREYAECLFKIVEYIQPSVTRLPSSACEFLGRNKVEERFRMIANSKLCFQATKWNYLLVAILCGILPCSIGYSQKEAPSEKGLEKQLEKDSAELTESLNEGHTKIQQQVKELDSKLWRQIIDDFNQLVKNAEWEKVEQLANETAKTAGPDDIIVQHMLLTSLNGVRKAKGQTAILVEELLTARNKEEIRFVQAYGLRSYLPPQAEEHDKFVAKLKECLIAAIDANPQPKPSSMGYNKDEQTLLVSTSRHRVELVDEIMKRIKAK